MEWFKEKYDSIKNVLRKYIILYNNFKVKIKFRKENKSVVL